MSTNLVVKVNNVEVDVLSAQIDLQLINQGHSSFSVLVDSGDYNAGDDIQIISSGTVLLSGYIDSVIDTQDQNEQWDFKHYVRLAGKDLSYDLSNKLITKTFPADEVDDIIAEAVLDSGADLIVDNSPITTSIGGHTSIDEPLLSLISQVLNEAQMEGIVTVSGTLEMWDFGAASRDSGVSLSKSNLLDIQAVDAQSMDIKNSITVLGTLNLFEPETDDAWTEDSLAGWELVQGDSLTIASGISQVGNNSIFADDTVVNVIEVKFTLPEVVRVDYHGQYTELGFYTLPIVGNFVEVRLHTDASNYFTTDIEHTAVNWQFHKIPLGYTQTYSDEYPDGIWTKVGNPDWLNITYIVWYINTALPDINIDGLFFGKKRTHGFASDATSIASYSKRELVIDVEAETNTVAQSMADTLLASLKDPVTIVKATVPLERVIDNDILPGYLIEIVDGIL